jgi:hypothetical protein
LKKQNTVEWITSKKLITVLIYNNHKLLVLYYKLDIFYGSYLFFQLEAEIMDDQRRNLKMKNSRTPGGPPTKRCRLLVKAEIIQDWRKSLQLRNSDPPGGPPPKRCRLLEMFTL